MLNQEQAENAARKIYPVSILANTKPAAVFLPLDLLQTARKNYVLTHLVDEIAEVCRMDHATFTATVKTPGKYKAALEALEAAQIHHNEHAK